MVTVFAATDAELSIMARGEVIRHLAEFGSCSDIKSTEVRGGMGEIWQFFIDADWSAVRDNLLAAGLGAAGSRGVRSAKDVSKIILQRMKLIGREVDDQRSRGYFVLRHTQTDSIVAAPLDALDADVDIISPLAEIGRRYVLVERESAHIWVVESE
ncbi:hypothetical protein [Nocardia iowensis]|uniref:Uncharacterized protein n=1 Tax=Nocardia iowensis TaxID=204891 RepID=A0ABX8RW58_NOCIO|nr:hypothetical protein [Nocardia iowensis]QXN93107.1 hypothetical protein KV110_08380 [Nocardia iowensis]